MNPFLFVLMLSLLFRPEDYFGHQNRYGDRFRKKPQPTPGLPAHLD